MSEKEMVDHPDHYNQGGHGNEDNIECIDALAQVLGTDGVAAFCRGNAVKYLWRIGGKENDLRDARKALWYVEKLVEYMSDAQQAATDEHFDGEPQSDVELNVEDALSCVTISGERKTIAQLEKELGKQAMDYSIAALMNDKPVPERSEDARTKTEAILASKKYHRLLNKGELILVESDERKANGVWGPGTAHVGRPVVDESNVGLWRRELLMDDSWRLLAASKKCLTHMLPGDEVFHNGRWSEYESLKAELGTGLLSIVVEEGCVRRRVAPERWVVAIRDCMYLVDATIYGDAGKRYLTTSILGDATLFDTERAADDALRVHCNQTLTHYPDAKSVKL